MKPIRQAERLAMMRYIDFVWNDAATSKATMRAIWAKSDGYGQSGYVPPQGYDWSGIRDSSDAAVVRMHRAAAEGRMAGYASLLRRQVR